MSQAYTYAIHREVRADYYAVCNGRRFVLFLTADMGHDPVLDFELKDVTGRWAEIMARLSPLALRSMAPGTFAKDLGLRLQRLGVKPTVRMLFTKVPIHQICRHSAEGYSIMGLVEMEADHYFASFDFPPALFDKLASILPAPFAAGLIARLYRWPTIVYVSTKRNPYVVDIDTRLSRELVEVKKEIFRPLTVLDFG